MQAKTNMNQQQVSGAGNAKEPSAAKHIHKLKNMIRQTKKINKLEMNISSFVSQEKDDEDDCHSQLDQSSVDHVGQGIQLSSSAAGLRNPHQL